MTLVLLHVLISAKLLARAERESAKEKLRTLPKLGKAAAKLVAALGVLLEVTNAHDDLAEQAADDSATVEPVSLAQSPATSAGPRSSSTPCPP